MSGFRFQDPFWLLLLIPLIVLGMLAIRRQRRAASIGTAAALLRAQGLSGSYGQARPMTPLP